MVMAVGLAQNLLSDHFQNPGKSCMNKQPILRIYMAELEFGQITLQSSAEEVPPKESALVE